MQIIDFHVDLHGPKSKLKPLTQMKFLQPYNMLTENRMQLRFLN